MNNLTLKDLHNPDDITAILTSNDGFIAAGDNQGFQEYPNKIELWEIRDNKLHKVKGWTTTVIATYGDPEE